MISIKTVILLLTFHYISDFLLQSREMAENKGKSIAWLTLHVFIYSVAMSFGFHILSGFEYTSDMMVKIIHFFVITFSTHWITDFITSKISSYFWLRNLGQKFSFMVGEIEEIPTSEEEKAKFRGKFWNTVGADQLIHAITLLLTWLYLIG
jgi:hypothetical protein